MLSRSQRLDKEHFNIVMEKGRVAHSSLFLFRILRGQTETRIAAVAPKKIIKTAVERNKIKRKTYNAIRLFKENIVSGVHIILIAKPTASKAKPIEINNDLKSAFVKVGLLR